MKLRSLFKLSLLSFLWLILLLLTRTQVTLAAVPVNDPNIPTTYKNILQNCDTKNYSPGLVQWIAPSGNGATTTKSITYPTKSIDMDFHYAGVTCYQAPSPYANVVSSYQLKIYNVALANTNPTGATVNGLSTAPITSLEFKPYDKKGSNSHQSTPFKFRTNAANGLEPGNYVMTISYRGINTRVPTSPDKYDCTVPPGYTDPITLLPYTDAKTANGFDRCPLVQTKVHLNISIINSQPAKIRLIQPLCRSPEKLNPAGFQINSMDLDAPNEKNNYSVHWELQQRIHNVYTPIQAGDLVNTFGNNWQGSNLYVPFNKPIADNSVLYQLYITTTGYGFPQLVEEYSQKPWGPCNLAGSTPKDSSPIIRIHPTCTLPKVGGPGFYITALDNNGHNFDVDWDLHLGKNTKTPTLKKGTMKGIFKANLNDPDPPPSHMYRMSNLASYNNAQSYTMHASSPGQNNLEPAQAAPPGHDTKTLGPCDDNKKDFTLKLSISKPILDDVSAPSRVDFAAPVVASRGPIKAVPNRRQFYILRGTLRIPIMPDKSTPFNIPKAASYTIKDISGLGGLLIGDKICIDVTIPLKGRVNGSGDATFEGNQTKTNCDTVSLGSYFAVYGGDVFAGSENGGLGDCVGWGNDVTNAGIFAFLGRSGGASDVRRGAAGEAGVSALGSIDNGALGGIYGFSSSRLRTTVPTAPNGLTFANSGAGAPGNSKLTHCPYDFWGNLSSAHSKLITNSINVNNQLTATDKNNYSVYSKASSVRVFAPSKLVSSSAAGGSTVRLNVYVEGNVYIDQDIIYAASGAWTNADQIPRLQVVAKGNIYINKDVTQLDGIYVAQTGTIYTCATAANTRAKPAELYGQCNKQLVINGAVVASRVKWLRTFSNLNRATPNEIQRSWSSHQCQTAGIIISKPTCAAEVINFTPETYLVTQPPATNADIIFDSEILLPPLL